MRDDNEYVSLDLAREDAEDRHAASLRPWAHGTCERCRWVGAVRWGLCVTCWAEQGEEDMARWLDEV